MSRKTEKHTLFGQAVLGVALLALLFAMAAGAVSHGDDNNSSRPCAICQLAHMPILDPGIPELIPSLAFVAPYAPNEQLVIDLDPWFHQHPSRAPPA
ncbi:MAG TPA: hypothetical protein VOA41_20720 [Candidatus Dormibacteraeota bacterium]|nr:hypothetical protein [Candidatus Dormibacteraeota bacterium]